jgi:23S rRNA (guanosine2251-2'-O)-methyltransferase
MASKNFVYGLHATDALINKHSEQIIHLFVQHTRLDKRIQNIIDLANQHKIPIQFVTNQKLQMLADTYQHQGVVAQIRTLKQLKEPDLDQMLSELTEPPLLLLLDNIQDPHNLGACLRSANAAGVHAVITPKDRSVGLTSTVKKVAAGATEYTPFIQVTNLARTMRSLKQQGIWIIGTADDAKQSLFEVDLKGPIAIVMGNEEKGLRHLTREHCDLLLKIPTYGSVSSLNVSVATGIFLFEIRRQRFQKTEDS